MFDVDAIANIKTKTSTCVASCLRDNSTCSSISVVLAPFTLPAASMAVIAFSSGLGPQNDVSISILCGDGDRDVADTAETADTADSRLTADPCEPTLEMRLVRPLMHSRAATSELAESLRAFCCRHDCISSNRNWMGDLRMFWSELLIWIVVIV